ncbi:MAG: TetR family transcriptional regulator [Nevskia sp.]|nr:TetR family transcriptional regulator [Nevskia sp.]
MAPMNDLALTPQRILEATEEVLRRHGPAKANVVDVARALGVSHGAVYRHFASKAALRDAVAERWLARMLPPLTAIVDEDAPAALRLRRWFDTLIAAKRGRLRDDAELFANYLALATEAREVVLAHLDDMVEMLASIVADGVASGEFDVADAHEAGRALLDGTMRFHNPVHAAEWSDPNADARFDALFALLLRGLGGKHLASERNTTNPGRGASKTNKAKTKS